MAARELGLPLRNCGVQFLQGGQAHPPHIGRIDHQPHDALIVHGAADRFGQVPQAGLGAGALGGLLDGVVQRRAAVFLDHVTLRPQYQGCVRLDDQGLPAVDESQYDDVHDQQEYEVQKQFSGAVYKAPDTAKYSGKYRSLGAHEVILGAIRLFYVRRCVFHNG